MCDTLPLATMLFVVYAIRQVRIIYQVRIFLLLRVTIVGHEFETMRKSTGSA
jgi:hypothetical protein